MKQVNLVLKNWMIILLMSFTTFAFAGHTPVLSTKIQTKTKFTLRLVNLKKANTKITIKDVKNQTLYTETLRSKEDYVKLFNFKKLPKGNYTINVTWEGGQITQPIIYKFKEMEISRLAQHTINTPTFDIAENKVKVGLVKSIKQKAKTLILDQSGKVVYKDKFEQVGKIKRQYNLSQLEEGDYTIQVNIDNKYFYKNIKVRK